MPESSIVIFADGPSQSRYRDFGIEKESLSIYACSESADILEQLKANVVVIDCGLSAKRGLTLLKKIKARHPRIPVIFLTDASSEELAVAAFRSGAREYFVNPVNRVILKRTVKGLVKLQKETSEIRLPYSPISDADHKSLPELDVRYLPLRLREILSYIEENLSGKIALTSLAHQARMSKHHFSRYFGKHVGMSPIKYVNFARIQRAKKLIWRGDLTIKEIAHQVGYDDQSALLRNFKKVEGKTPSEFRRRPGGDHCGFM
jgi:YesN/AraC family two-component response regulator